MSANIFMDQILFMAACGQSTIQANAKQAALYFSLVEEEYNELLDARTEIERADAVIDMIVVLVGAGVSCGWDIQALWDEVLRSNMSKIDPETGRVRRRADGKILKPDGWKSPDIESILYKSKAD